MQESLVQFLGWEDPLEKGQATHSSVSLATQIGYPKGLRMGCGYLLSILFCTKVLKCLSSDIYYLMSLKSSF